MQIWVFLQQRQLQIQQQRLQRADIKTTRRALGCSGSLNNCTALPELWSTKSSGCSRLGRCIHWPWGTRVGASISPATKTHSGKVGFQRVTKHVWQLVMVFDSSYISRHLGKNKRPPKVSSDEQKHPEGWLGPPQQPPRAAQHRPGATPRRQQHSQVTLLPQKNRRSSPHGFPLPPALRRCPHLHCAHGGRRPLRRHGAQLRRQRLHLTRRTRQSVPRCSDQTGPCSSSRSPNVPGTGSSEAVRPRAAEWFVPSAQMLQTIQSSLECLRLFVFLFFFFFWFCCLKADSPPGVQRVTHHMLRGDIAYLFQDCKPGCWWVSIGHTQAQNDLHNFYTPKLWSLYFSSLFSSW